MGSIEAGGVQSSPSSSKKKKKSKSKVEQPVTTPAPQQVES
jgi:hypothetical protein